MANLQMVKRVLGMVFGLSLVLTTLQYEVGLLNRAVAALGGEAVDGEADLRPPIDVAAGLERLTAVIGR